MFMFTVALTGGIGSGKSAVEAEFKRLGVSTIDTDNIAREIVSPGEPALHEIVEKFGSNIVGEDGHLKRHQLRKIIFSDSIKRQQLESILHPRIKTCTKMSINKAEGSYCVVSIPLLFETKQEATYDRILVVDVPVETQINRTANRDGSPRETIAGILAAQVDRTVRLRLADDVIDNSGNIMTLRNQVNRLHEKYLMLALQN